MVESTDSHAVSAPVPLQTRSILRDSEKCHTPSLYRVKACWQVVVKTKAQKKIWVSFKPERRTELQHRPAESHTYFESVPSSDVIFGEYKLCLCSIHNEVKRRFTSVSFVFSFLYKNPLKSNHGLQDSRNRVFKPSTKNKQSALKCAWVFPLSPNKCCDSTSTYVTNPSFYIP